MLSDDLQDQLVIAYNLIIDNKRIQSAKEEEDDFKVKMLKLKLKKP